MFTIAEKENNNNRYSYTLGYITGTNYQDDYSSGKMDNSTDDFAEVDFNDTNNVVYMQNEDALGSYDNTVLRKFIIDSEVDDAYTYQRGLNFVLVSIDCDNDGTLARYNDTKYSYTDPQVEAVLQAAPYFEEIGGFDTFGNNETSYSIIKSYTTSTSETDSVSFGCGFAGQLSVSTGEALEISTQLGYSMDWDKGYEQSFATTYTTTWSATYEDIVIICRTPVFHYLYDVYDYVASEWKNGEFTISVPQKPMYYMLNVDQYNEFVNEYNGYLQEVKTTRTLATAGLGVASTSFAWNVVMLVFDILRRRKMPL